MSISYGYARVSSRDQNPDRQIIALQEAGVKKKILLLRKKPVRILTDLNIYI